MPRWRSRAVVLVVLGSGAAIAGCSNQTNREETYKRNGYETREACLRDYPPEQCQEARSGGGGLMFLGPWYMANRARAMANDPGPGATAINGRSQAGTSEMQTRRSGFGSTGRSAGFRGG